MQEEMRKSLSNLRLMKVALQEERSPKAPVTMTMMNQALLQEVSNPCQHLTRSTKFQSLVNLKMLDRIEGLRVKEGMTRGLMNRIEGMLEGKMTGEGTGR